MSTVSTAASARPPTSGMPLVWRTSVKGTAMVKRRKFMNRFRKMGFIDYNGGSTDVHSSLLNVILHD